ncbi:MAG: aminotransferase class V-fold PLP-dependent enzyme [Candidatus Hydrogenedens sp.]|nr:aminotransferase class V-fold PLP-dependent enzyme [Candidatus Hydrogenedens sp.]
MNHETESTPLATLPFEGQTKAAIFEALDTFRSGDVSWRSGRMLGYTYNPGADPMEVAHEAYMQYLTENGLDWTVFPSMHKLETDLVHIVRELLRGDEAVVGSCTSGGTESILCAVKAAREYARAHKPHITQPEMVLPETAHGAFHKACLYFGIKPVMTGYNPQTFHADVDAIRNAITENTILIVASAPGYAQGVIDPIREIGQVALERGVLFHVDGCVGGIHLSFMRRMGHDVPDFDFTVPGVTSISADLHKYAYAPKNISCVLYRSKEIRFHQYFSNRRNTCYALVNPGVLSTKSGGPYAGAWALMHFLGEAGYRRIVEKVQDATRLLVDGINAIEGLRVLGNPDMCMFSFTSDDLNIFELADRIRLNGFYMQPQFTHGETPANLHISMNWGTSDVVDDGLAALRKSVDEVRADSGAINLTAVRAQVQGLLADLGPGAGDALRDLAGITEGGLPERMALINSVIDALPDELAEHMLSSYMNEVFV